MQKKKSRAWDRFFCVRRRGELQFAHITICPYCKFIPCCKIRPHCISPILQIHPCFQLTIMGGRIALNGKANCNSPLRVCYPNVDKYHVNTCKYVCKHTKKHHGHGMRAFACVIQTLANIHVNI